MKKLLLFFSLLLSLLPLSAAAEIYSVVYANLASITPATAPKKNHVLLNTGKIGWDITSNSTYLAKDGVAPKGIKLGKKAEPATIATFASSDNENSPFKGKIIKSAIINAGGSKTITNPTLELYVDEIKVGEPKTLAAGTHTECQFDNIDIICQSSVKIVLQQTNSSTTSANSLTLGDFSITYEDAPVGPVDYTLDITNELTLEEGQDFDISGFDIPADAPALTWTSSDENVVAEIDGTLLAGEAGTATLTASWEASEKYNAGHHDIAVTVIKPAPVGMPVVTINDKTIEDGCFYEISNGSTATVTADKATAITVNGKKVENGSFIIDAATLYEITASNDVSEENLSFNVRLIEPQQGEPTPEVWKQVNNAADVTTDGKYIIVANNQNVAISTAASGNYMGNVSVTIDNNSIAALPTNAMVFTISNAESDGQYRWNCTNAAENTSSECYLYSGTGSNNYLKAGENTNLSVSTISINETTGVATITFVNCKNSEGTERHIGCNTNNKNVFGAYANNNQAPIYIYKLFGGEPTTTHSTKEYLDLPDFEHDVTAKKITFTCSNSNVLFEEKHYDATASQSYAPKAVADGWNAMADGVFDHSAFTNDIILETSAYREDADGNRIVASPIHAMRISASGTITGIEGVAAEAEGEGVLYNLQGVRVDRRSAAPGLYIERRGGKAVKVIL